LDWQQIPLEEAMHTHHIDVKIGPIDNPILHNPGAVSMGNPHCVFFVKNFTDAKPESVGPMIEFHPLFPEQVNVGFDVEVVVDGGVLNINWREADNHVIMTGPVALESEGVI